MADTDIYVQFVYLFKEDPVIGILLFLVWLIVYSSIAVLITSLFFSIFPVLFALLRKKPTTKKRFSIYCYCINIIAFVGNAVLGSGVLTVVGYIMWTNLGKFFGMKILKRRGKLLEAPKPKKPIDAGSFNEKKGRIITIVCFIICFIIIAVCSTAAILWG